MKCLLLKLTSKKEEMEYDGKDVNVDVTALKDDEKYNYDRMDVIEKIQYLPSLIKSIKFYEPKYKSGPYELSLIKNYERLSKIERTSNLKELYNKK